MNIQIFHTELHDSAGYSGVDDEKRSLWIIGCVLGPDKRV